MMMSVFFTNCKNPSSGIGVGGFRSCKVIEKTIRDNDISYISMSRPFVREPGLVNRRRQGDRTPARCISCNSSFKPGLEDGWIYCEIEKKSRTRRPEVNHIPSLTSWFRTLIYV
jgi:hypothetical protein